MAKRDYYDVLGLNKGVSINEVKDAYKRLAKKYHPDVSKEADAEEKFKEVLEAYKVLSDPQKKDAYDKYGHAAEGFQQFGGFDFGPFSHMEFDFGDLFSERGGFGGAFSELFKEFGMGGTGRRRETRGSSIRYDLDIAFEEAVFGAEKEIEITRLERCKGCKGSGSKDEKKSSCATCNGSGIEQHSKRTPFGYFATQTTCRKCKGEGKVIDNPCKKCDGKGLEQVKRKIKVKIPEGIDAGANLRLHGEGNQGEAGAGDLFIVIFVEPHKIFKRSNSDVFCEIPLGFTEAALGSEIDVPTLKGKAELKIPQGTQTGTVFKMKGLGVKDLNSGKKGDQYVKVFVRTPEKLSKKQKELYEELRKLDEVSKKRKSFFGVF